jgi:phytoene synthase
LGIRLWNRKALVSREREDAVRTVARDGDPDRYASALFAPRASREPLFALYAFNVALASIAEQVSEPQLGEIRLQWWRDALDRATAGEATGHPVADAVGGAIRRYALSRDSLAGLIDARSFDVSVKIMPDAAALDDYLGKTAGALFRLAAEVAAPHRTSELEPAVRAAGIAYGLTGLMRALPVHAARGRVDLPADMLLRHGTSPEQILAGKASKGLADVLAELRDTARVALKSSQVHVAMLPRETRKAFLPLALVDPYLSALRKVDPLRQVAEINPLYRLWRLGTCRFPPSA